jgi:hypothetical protein
VKRIENQSSRTISSWETFDDFAIIVTTFEERFFTYALPLIEAIRESVDVEIFLVVNGNYRTPINRENYSFFLNSVTKFVNVFPICFGTLHGCASMWNTGILHSGKNRLLILNDDITIEPSRFAHELHEGLNALSKYPLLTINLSWSHFFISAKCIDDVGYFDDRFLGFGYEDNDYIIRYEQVYAERVPNIAFSGFVSLIDSAREEDVVAGFSKYSLFNSCFIQVKYPEFHQGNMSLRHQSDQRISLLPSARPEVEFRRNFLHLLESSDRETIVKELEDYSKRLVEEGNQTSS